MADEKRPRQTSPKGLSGADFAGLGIQFAAAIVIFVFAGQWLDNRFDGNGLFIIAGAFVGAVGGFMGAGVSPQARGLEAVEPRA